MTITLCKVKSTLTWRDRRGCTGGGGTRVGWVMWGGLDVLNEAAPRGHVDVHLVGSQHLPLLHEQLLLSLQFGLPGDHRVQELDLWNEGGLVKSLLKIFYSFGAKMFKDFGGQQLCNFALSKFFFQN